MTGRTTLYLAILFLLAACQPAATPTPAASPGVTPPAATSLPPTVAPSAAPPVEPVKVLAFCTLIGRDARTYVSPGAPVSILWGWSAVTEQQVKDYIENNITRVTLDGKEIAGKQDGIQKNANSGEPEIIWYEDVGVLEPGTHVVTYEVRWKKMITDGHASFGPGSDTESVQDRCEIIVTDAPPTPTP